MKILYIASIRMPTEKAAGLAIAMQCDAFARLGHEVTLIKPARKNSIKEDFFSYFNIKKSFLVIDYFTLDFLKFGTLGFFITRLIEMISIFIFLVRDRKNTDLIYCRDQWSLFLPLFLGVKVKMVCELHSKHSDFLTNYVVKNISRLVVISSGLKSCYEKIRSLPIQVEPSGVDLKQFENLPPVETIRKKYDLPVDAFIFGYIGKYQTMGEEKGVDGIITAFGMASGSIPNGHLFVAGLEENEFDKLKNKLDEVDVSKTKYTLKTLEPRFFAEYLHACDVLLMNYPKTEHYDLYMSPSKLFGYMASGKIIIVSELQTIKEIVTSEMAVLVKPDNTSELAKAIARVYSQRDLYIEMGGRARKKVQRYEWVNRAKSLFAASFKL